jgi:integrase
VWYVSYFSAQKMKRVHVATRWRVDDPTGHKNALRFAEEKSRDAAPYREVNKTEVWSAWVVPYLENHYRRQKKTLKRYLGAWDWIRTFVEEENLPHPQSVTYNHVMRFITWRSSRERHCGKIVSRNTAICDVKLWGIVMREAVRRGYCTTNPCLKLGIQRDPPKEKSEILDAEADLITRLLNEKEASLPITDRWMSTSFRIASLHGCRLSETQIPMTAIDFARQTMRLSAKGRNGKAKVYTVRIHPQLMPLLLELQAARATITCVHPPMASKDFHTFFQSRPELSHLSFHCTRVTVITKLARAGVPIQQAMAYVGHASQTVHKIYQKLKAEDLSLCTQAISYG